MKLPVWLLIPERLRPAPPRLPPGSQIVGAVPALELDLDEVTEEMPAAWRDHLLDTARGL